LAWRGKTGRGVGLDRTAFFGFEGLDPAGGPGTPRPVGRSIPLFMRQTGLLPCTDPRFFAGPQTGQGTGRPPQEPPCSFRWGRSWETSFRRAFPPSTKPWDTKTTPPRAGIGGESYFSALATRPIRAAWGGPGSTSRDVLGDLQRIVPGPPGLRRTSRPGRDDPKDPRNLQPIRPLNRRLRSLRGPLTIRVSTRRERTVGVRFEAN